MGYFRSPEFKGGQTGPAGVSYDDKGNNMMIIVGFMVVVMMVGFILRGEEMEE